MFFASALACIYIFYCSSFGDFWNYDLLFGAIAITVVAAAESTVGLALIALLHDKSKSIMIKRFK
jgi:NADH:ubiquinone oxidoreductase subunit K